MSTLKLIESAISRGSHHLGDIVWWSLSDARINRDDLIRIWARESLPRELLPEEPSTERAFKSAIREAQIGHPDRLLRLAVETSDEIVFGVVREERHGDGTLTYHQESRITLERGREQVTADAPNHSLVADVLHRFELLRATHVSDDVRRTIVRTLDIFAAVSLRPSGGVYWVPVPYAPDVRRLQAAIQRIGTSVVSVLPVHRGPEAEQTLGEVARGSIEDELAALRAEIAGFVETPPDRTSTLERRLDAFEALRDRAKLYRNVLAIQVTDLDQQLDSMTATVSGLIHQKSKAA